MATKSEKMKRKLILFDIDGTLIKGCKVHDDSFSEGIRKVYGIEASKDEIESAGKTDKRIIIELLNKKGVPKEKICSNIKKVYDVMITYCKKNIKSDSSVKVMPNVKKLLILLKERGHILGLLTGNLREIAKLKMKKTGLVNFFKVGSFGEESEKRSELVKKAIKVAEKKYKIKFKKDDVFIVGNTPLDVECGKESGVKTIAIAAGPYSIKKLKEHSPDFLFKDFSNINLIIKSIEN